MSLRGLAKEVGVSVQFLSQVRYGKRPMPAALRAKVEALDAYNVLFPGKPIPERVVQALTDRGLVGEARIESPVSEFLLAKTAVETFINTRKATTGLTKTGEKWLRYTLGKFVAQVPLPVNQVRKEHIIRVLAQYQDTPWRRHSLYRALKTFFRWASDEYDFANPMAKIPAPKTPDLVLYAITPDKVERLLASAENARDKAIIALLADSGARRSEAAGIAVRDLDMERCRIKVMGKGNKEGYIIFGPATKALLEQYIEEAQPQSSLFGLTTHGIQSMFYRLQARTGIKCNAHSFRRGFTTTLRRAGVRELDIQQLGRWSSLEMVRRYTKSYTFEDAAARYKPIVT